MDTIPRKILRLRTHTLKEIQEELDEIKGFYALAKNIQRNSKGDNLVEALRTAFTKLKELKAKEKA